MFEKSTSLVPGDETDELFALREDLREAPTLPLNDSRYDFRLFSVGERGSSLSPRLMHEVKEGLVKKIRPLIGQIDYVVAVQPAGAMWALLVSEILSLPLKIVTSSRSSINGQRTIQFTGSYSERTLFLPHIEPESKVVIVDDVISSGITLRTLVNALREQGIEIVAAFCIVDKLGGSIRLGRELRIRLEALVSLTELS